MELSGYIKISAPNVSSNRTGVVLPGLVLDRFRLIFRICVLRCSSRPTIDFQNAVGNAIPLLAVQESSPLPLRPIATNESRFKTRPGPDPVGSFIWGKINRSCQVSFLMGEFSINEIRASKLTGFTRWPSKPASWDFRRSSSCPHPVRAISRILVPHTCCRINRQAS